MNSAPDFSGHFRQMAREIYRHIGVATCAKEHP